MKQIKYYILRALSLLDFFIPKNKKMIAFSSFPDFSDNAFAMYIYMMNNYSTEYRYIWLTNKNKKIEKYGQIEFTNKLESYIQKLCNA